MGLFGKKRGYANTCRGGSRPSETAAQPDGAEPAAEVKVLGSGCAKCNALEDAVRAALTELGMDPAIGHVTDFAQIAAYGVMATPALVVDGKVVSCGRVLRKEEAKAAIQQARGGAVSGGASCSHLK